MKSVLFLFALLCSLAACRSTLETIAITSGGISNNTSTNPDDLILSNETFAYHSTADGMSISPSNTIKYTAYRVGTEINDISRKSSAKKAKLKCAEKAEIIKREREEKKKVQRLKKEKTKKYPRSKRKNEEKKLRKQLVKEASFKIKKDRLKPQYANIDIKKYFYKKNILNPIFNLMCIPLAIPTFGQSFKWIHPVTRKEFAFSRACNDKSCVGRKNATKTKILIELNARIKRDEIQDNIVIIENLPDSFELKTFKIKKGGGSGNVKSITHEELTKNGETYHQFTIIPKKGSFMNNFKVGILLYVTITPSQYDLIPESVSEINRESSLKE